MSGAQHPTSNVQRPTSKVEVSACGEVAGGAKRQERGRRPWKPGRTGMMTGKTLPCNGLSIAIAEGNAGHLVSVCSRCVSEDLRGVLQGLQNVSHGYCPVCLERALAEIEARAATRGEPQFTRGEPQPERSGDGRRQMEQICADDGRAA